MNEAETLQWLDDNTMYSELSLPTPSNLLYFARSRGGANLTADDDRRYRLTHSPAGYALECLD